MGVIWGRGQHGTRHAMRHNAVQFTPSSVRTVRVSVSENYQNIRANLENRGQRHRVLRIVWKNLESRTRITMRSPGERIWLTRVPQL